MSLALREVTHEPTVPPGGPGLWHHKGWQLPPLMQHVFNDLVESGHPHDSRTYRLAVGIVHNWADGHDGKGHHVKPDTAAKARKDIEEWNAMRAATKAGHLVHAIHDGLAAIPEELRVVEGLLRALAGPTAPQIRHRAIARGAALLEAREERPSDVSRHEREVRRGLEDLGERLREASVRGRDGRPIPLGVGAATAAAIAASGGHISPAAAQTAAQAGAQGGPGGASGTWDPKKHPRGRGGKWITSGMTGQNVQAVQKQVGAKQDGKFGPKTKQAVMAYQRAHGLKVDGIVGAQTAAAFRGQKAAPGPLRAADHRHLGGGRGGGGGGRGRGYGANAPSAQQLAKTLTGKPLPGTKTAKGTKGRGTGTKRTGSRARRGTGTARGRSRGGVGRGVGRGGRSRGAASILSQGIGMKGSPNSDVRHAQALLDHLGYSLARDGRFGPLTAREVRRFQRDQKLPVTGKIDRRTLNALRNAGKRGKGKTSIVIEAEARLQEAVEARKAARTGAEFEVARAREEKARLALAEADGKGDAPRDASASDPGHNVKCPKCDTVQSATHKACSNCGHDLAAARKAKFAKLQEAGLDTRELKELYVGPGSPAWDIGTQAADITRWDPAKHPRARAGEFARVLGGSAGGHFRLPSGVTVKPSLLGGYVIHDKNGNRVHIRGGASDARRAADAALRAHDAGGVL